MVRSVTFEIRWHDTQPIYSSSFQPIAGSQLKRVLDYNVGQAAGLAPDKTLGHTDDPSAPGPSSSSSGAANARNAPLDIAGGQNWRLATAGGDNNVRIWLVKPSIPSPAAMASAAAAAQGLPTPSPHPPRVEYLATLSRHSGVVNCVRFSPSGDLLASAGDDGTVMLWHLTDRPLPAFGDVDDAADSAFEKEHWRMIRMIRVSTQEIYDMAWSPNGEHLIVGGTDFVARVINPHDGTILKEYSDHSHYVQGVAWDPLDAFLATQSSDRSVHVHALQHHGGSSSSNNNNNGSSASTNSAATKGNSSSSSSSGYVPPVTRNSKMDVHRRTHSASMPAWEQKPAMHRGSSHTSHIESDTDDSAREDRGAAHSTGPRRSGSQREGFAAVRGRTGRSHTPMDPPHAAVPGMAPVHGTPHLPTRGATPTPASSVPQSPAFSTASTSAHPMNPPQRTPSRRSSFSGSQAEGATSPPTSIASFAPNSASAASIYKAAVGSSADTPHHSLSVVTGTGAGAPSARRSISRPASIRSPSPAPLPAIRPPPSPRQRIQAAQQISSAAGVTGSSSASMAAITPLQVGMRMYGDEAFSGFFRRLAFSPDGALLVTPSGIFESNQTTPASPSFGSSPTNSKSPGFAATTAAMSSSSSSSSSPHGPGPRSTVYLYGRASFSRPNAPIAHLPGHKTATLVVRFSPILYELRKTHASAFAKSEDGGGVAPHPNIPLEAGKQKSVSLDLQGSSSASSKTATTSATTTTASSPPRHDAPPPPISMIGLPYRMVFAVATHDVVWIYDTQQGGPLCCFSNMHYASFTDLTWSADGQTLIMSSSDGYCSVAVFDYGELGQPYSYSAQPSLSVGGHHHHQQHVREGTGTGAGTNSTPAVNTLATKKKKSSGGGNNSGGATKVVPPTLSSPPPAAGGSSLAAPASKMARNPSSCSLASASSNASSPVLNADVALATTTTTTEEEEEAPKKKRRIQPTLHGP